MSPIVPVHKPNGALRLCVDYRKLNKHVIRERHLLTTVEEIAVQLEVAKVFSVDVESGFHQILLDKSSRSLTTFATHCSLYHFKCICLYSRDISESNIGYFCWTPWGNRLH